MKKSDYLVIIPAYNEEDSIRELVGRARKYADVCVVNDCSTDSTPRILNAIDGIAVIHHEVNTHIPGAVLDGMKYAVEHGYAFSITMDAGLSHNPDEIPLFIEHGPADLVIGWRKTKTNTPLYRKSLSLIGNVIYNICLDFPGSAFRKGYFRDITSGFRRYSSSAMKLLLSSDINSKSFDFLFESAMHIYRKNLVISEVPITYDYSNSSLNSKVVWNCLSTCSKNIFRSQG